RSGGEKPCSRRRAQLALGTARRASAQRRPDVDRSVVLDRHEGCPDAHDHALGVPEELIGGLVAIAVDGDLDSDLVNGSRVQPVLPQLLEQPVAIRDPGSLNLYGVAHGAILPHDRRRKTPPTGLAKVPAVAVATGREFPLFINGERAEPASGETRDLTEPATGAALATVAVGSEQDVDRAVEAA